MGFWTDKDKEENQNPFESFQNNQNSFFQQSFSTFRQCRKDANDNSFIICKNVTQNLNKDGQFETTESEEERIPVDQFYKNTPNPFQGISPIFGMMERLMDSSLNTFNHGFDNIEKSIAQPQENTFFGRLKNLFNDDSFERDIQKYYKSFQNTLQGTQGNEEKKENKPEAIFQKNFSSSSSSRSCKQDLEDENYLICTTTIKRNVNGQESIETKEDRVPRLNQQNNQNTIKPSDIFGEITSPGIFFQSPLFMPFTGFAQNSDPYVRQNNNDSRNSNNSNNSNGYKYPQYEEKKSKKQSGIYDL